MSRTRCEDVDIVESLICILPHEVLDNPLDEDLPHPDIKNAFISPKADFTQDLWIYWSNPYHSAQPNPGRRFNNGFKVINRGRKIATRGRVTVSFEPQDQVLADKMTIHSGDGTDIGGVKVTCHLDGGNKEESGFLDIFDSETLTVGWNCEMSSLEIRVPWIVSGLVESRTDDDQIDRTKRGLKEFSILAQNVAGKETFGFNANDRISRFNKMMGTGGSTPITLLGRSTTGGLGWPIILAIAMTVAGVVIIGVVLHVYKKMYGLSWKTCGNSDRDSGDTDSVVEKISIHSIPRH